ncbi:MAG: phosphoadenosine phosphosulfate reductase family protein [Flavobacteriales bacterium]|jgi:hypothetical protein
MNTKEKLLVSFSGGETSAYMAKWIIDNWSEKYDIKYVFANTGQENEETLEFINECAKYFNIEVVWVEALINKENGKGTRHRVVDFNTASRNGEPFEDVIAKHGIPNQATPHCNRELKLAPINSYMKSIGWKDYYTVIGIRADEIDRVNDKRKERKLLYPLVTNNPVSKLHINSWWAQQPFRLKLKGYQGNCKTCWKKSFPKLKKLARENEEQFDFFKLMEAKYGEYIPEHKLKKLQERGEKWVLPITFFRGHISVEQIIQESKNFDAPVYDDASNVNYQINLFDELEGESCDIFSNCGDL